MILFTVAAKIFVFYEASRRAVGSTNRAPESGYGTQRKKIFSASASARVDWLKIFALKQEG
jgi:hypothetical protein